MNIFHTIIRRVLVLCCALGALQGYGQGYFKVYPAANGNANDAALTADGGYIMAGVFQNSGIQKTAANGNVLWSTPNAFGDGLGIAVCNTSDGGCVAVGEDYTGAGGRKNIVVRTNAMGAKQWETVLPNFQLPNGIKSIAATPDGQFIACGITRDAQLKQQIWLVKLDGGGNIVWNKALGQSNLSEQVARMIPCGDGNFAITGDVLNIGNNRDLFLAKVDADGNLLWEKIYAKPLYQVAKDLVETSDGGLVMLCDNLQSNPGTQALLKADAQGNELWYEHLNTSGLHSTQVPFSAAPCLTRDQNDNLYVPIHTSFDGNLESTLYLVQLNGLGQMVDYFQLSNTEYVRRIYLTSDNFLAFLGGDDATQAFLLKTDLDGQLYSSRILGSIYDDQNDNCNLDAGENGFADYKVEALSSTGETFYTKTNINGDYSLRVSEGNYQIIVHPKNNILAFGAPCDTPTVSITAIGQVANLPEIGVFASAHCPLMTVTAQGSRFRRCLPNYVTINYCNEGNLPAQNVSVQLLKDPLLTYVGSSTPLTAQNSNLLTFDLNDDCGSFWVEFSLSCDAVIGQNICLDAHVFPDDNCLPPSANWDGSNLIVKGECNNGVQFKVTNNGNDMTESADYVIIEDQIMLTNSLILKAGKDTTITFSNPSGHSYYLRVQQTPGNPGFGDPAAAVVDCGGNSGPNLALQLPNQYDSYPATYLYCDEVVGSFDPNDKTGYPLGWKAAHLVEPDQELNYVIRFQNTGNDTAFTVKIEDRLSDLLDPGTIITGAGSHPYSWDIKDGRNLKFYFPNILLPDSNVNVAGSQGFVSFRIKPRKGLPLGTIIENSSDIYFDFNAPILTNTTRHQLGQPMLSLVPNPGPDQLRLDVFPNPFSDQTTVRLKQNGDGSEKRFSLYDPQGNMIRTETFAGQAFQLYRSGLNAGLYFFRLQTADGKQATGKLIVH